MPVFIFLCEFFPGVFVVSGAGQISVQKSEIYKKKLQLNVQRKTLIQKIRKIELKNEKSNSDLKILIRSQKSNSDQKNHKNSI